MQLENSAKYDEFVTVRAGFERVLVEYDYLPQQIIRRYRSALGSYLHIADYYLDIINLLGEGKSIDDVIRELLTREKFSYLTLVQESVQIASSDFSSERKSAVFIKAALKSAPKCTICGGLIHRNSITVDHIERRQDGGLGKVDNGQIAHPYCNTTYKN